MVLQLMRSLDQWLLEGVFVESKEMAHPWALLAMVVYVLLLVTKLELVKVMLQLLVTLLTYDESQLLKSCPNLRYYESFLLHATRDGNPQRFLINSINYKYTISEERLTRIQIT